MRRAVELHPGGARERDASVGLGWGMGVDFESHGPTLLKRRRRGDDERSPVLRGLEIYREWVGGAEHVHLQVLNLRVRVPTQSPGRRVWTGASSSRVRSTKPLGSMRVSAF